MRRTDHGHAIAFGGGEGPRVDFESAGHDQQAHVLANGKVLHIPAVAHDDQQPFARAGFEPACERLQPHGADHQDKLVLAVRIAVDQQPAVERGCQLPRRRQHAAAVHEPLGDRKQELTERARRKCGGRSRCARSCRHTAPPRLPDCPCAACTRHRRSPSRSHQCPDCGGQ
jgi:hypothetical protein